MSSHVESRPEHAVPTGAQLAAPFHVFVLVCDRDKTVGPRAVLEFQKFLARSGRGASRGFSQMLDFCRRNYAVLWQDYASARLEIDLGGFLELLTSLEASMLESEHGDLVRDLARLAKALFRAGFLLRPRAAQERAFSDFMHVLLARELPDGAEKPRRERPAPEFESGPDPAAGAAPVVPRAAETQSGEPCDDERDPPQAPGRAALPVMPPPGDTWTNGAVRLVCTKIVDEARHVKTFSFAGRASTLFRYEPGQFLTIEPVINGRKVPRSYTISSTPTRPALLEITVKRVPGGLVSNWLHDNMRVGEEIDARGPFGKFSCLRVPRDKYLFLVAGSGVTPLMAMLRYLYDVAAPVDVVFFQSAATREDIIFEKELALIGERNPRFRVAITLTQAPAEGAWDGLAGRLDNAMLRRIAPDFAQRMVLACGPAGYVDKAKQLLAGNGFPLATQFEEESFTPKHAKSTEGPGAGPAGTASRIRFVKSGKVVETAPGETILEAAERCGLWIPSSCRQGRCGTCKVTALSGEVSMPDQEALSPDETAQGEILACIGEPRTSEIAVDL